jgi:hypothetical protein
VTFCSVSLDAYADRPHRDISVPVVRTKRTVRNQNPEPQWYRANLAPPDVIVLNSSAIIIVLDIV